MKQRITQILPVEFENINFNNVESIEFVFNQNGKNKYKCSYPSSVAYLQETGGHVVDVEFSNATSALFVTGEDHPIYMDTRITLTGSKYQPQTDIVSFYLKETLFTE